MCERYCKKYEGVREICCAGEASPSQVGAGSRPRRGRCENSPSLQRWDQRVNSSQVRETDGRPLKRTPSLEILSPASRALDRLVTIDPALKRWAIVIRPLRGR